MSTEVHIDKAGRIVVPKKIRDGMGLSPGDPILIEADGEQITLRPVHDEPIMKKEHGIWVHQGTLPPGFSIIDFIDEEREKRAREMLGDFSG
jgi:AbrB family looped-hinge helix DNA binding protein